VRLVWSPLWSLQVENAARSAASGGTKVALSAHDNARLSAWQREHLLLTSFAREQPWEIESEVIAQLAPPLNSAANAVHAFYPTLRAARAELRKRARAASSSSAKARTIR
jgi:hypothetical protein